MNMLNEAKLASRDVTGTSNYSSVNDILTWILATSMVLAVLVKVAMKVVSQNTFNVDDAVLVLALVSQLQRLLQSLLKEGV